MVKTRIICTIGPASESASVLRRMILSGMDIARLNFSHGEEASHQRRLDTVRALNKKYRRAIKILQDLEGYRIRLGRLKDSRPIPLKKGQTILLTNKNIVGQGDTFSFDYEGRLSDIKTGSHIYIDDGTIVLLVKGRLKGYLKAQVVIAGALKEHKGINIPDTPLRFKGLTDKDRKDLAFGIKNKTEYIAQSFVRGRLDMIHLRDFIGARFPGCRLIAKIESREGVRNIDDILEVSDGIMIARGDMGVCLPIYEIPMIQKMIIRKCNRKKKMVITATQMLESMTENLRPTRAEVTDVANAVLDGSDCLMLSAETAVGVNPVEVVRMMNRIIEFTEQRRGAYGY